MWMFGFSTNNPRSIWIAAAIVGVVLVAILLRRFFMDNTQPTSKRDEELRSATGDFRIRIGVGATSFVYLAELHDQRFAAIKRLFQNNNNNNSMLFLNELSVLLRISHPNLVALLGFCFHKGEQLLVLEYVPNKSLFDRMHTHPGQSSGILSWQNRLNIALDVAKALYYLHYVADPPVIHRDIKSSNILLIDDNHAKLADFGLCKLGHHHLDTTTTTTNSPSPKQGPSSSSVKGSYGYIDTHYLMTGQVSHKSDVYSFGVVLMELVTGLSSTQGGSATLAETTEEWRRRIDDMNDQELVGTLLDPKLKGEVANVEEVRMLIQVANLALLPNPEARPDMSYILRTIST
ncbi:hypothetical protein UlMin_005052 [Ulmus minor]